MLKKLQLMGLAALCSVALSSAHAREISYNNSPAEKEQYLAGLLSLALEKSQSNHVIAPLNEVLTESKWRSEVAAGSVDVFWGSASAENDESFLTVRIPLVKGLLGYRLFLIRQGEQARFDSVHNLADLRALVAGQGRFWADTQILTQAQLPVESAVRYESLFYMLEGGRFDYFPRAAHELWGELAANTQLNLAVESNLMLKYPLAMHFYVNKNDQALATALTQGLEAAIADGSFDAYFYSNPLIQSVLSRANLAQRRVIEIDNPFLPAATPLARKELWLDIASLPQQTL